MAARPRSGVALASPPSQPLTTDGTQTRTQAGATATGVRGLPNLGPRGYLYTLVLVEVGIIGLLRYVFRDHHGG